MVIAGSRFACAVYSPENGGEVFCELVGDESHHNYGSCEGKSGVRWQLYSEGPGDETGGAIIAKKGEETDRNVLLIVRIEPGIIGGHIRGLFIATHKVHTIIDPFRHLAFFRP